MNRLLGIFVVVGVMLFSLASTDAFSCYLDGSSPPECGYCPPNPVGPPATMGFDSGYYVWICVCDGVTSESGPIPKICPGNDEGPPNVTNYPTNHPQNACGSVIGVEKQTLGEGVPIVGTPFSLTYSSERVPGNVTKFQAMIPLTLGAPPGSLTDVNLSILIAGRTIPVNTHLPGADTNYTFTWDGYDSSSSLVNGPATFQVYRTEVYSPPVSGYPEAFQGTVGVMARPNIGLGGWSLNINHYYDSTAETLYLGDGSSYNVGYGTPPTGTYMAGSADGTELYTFDSNGRHLQTLTAITGSTKYTFAYDGSGNLTSVTVAFSNVTTINRTGATPTSIVGPYGQTTTLSVDTNGYLSAIQNPNSETYNLTTGSTGLLATFQKPDGITSTFTYDSSGKLLTDSSSAGSSTTLSTVITNSNTTVNQTSALSITSSHVVLNQTSGYYRTDTSAAGFISNYSEQLASAGVSISDSTGYGDATDATEDVRLGPMSNFTTANNESHYSYTNYPSYSQSVSLNSSNIFDINTLTTIKTLNGYNTSTQYVGSTKTYTTTTPVGRHFYKTIDVYERPTSTHLASFTPFTYAYDTNGRLSTINQGVSRQATISYNTSGYVSSIQNPLSQTTSFSYDSAGRVTTQTLPDTRYISYTYDSNGNLASITPPGKAAHTLNHNSFDLLASYVTPTAFLFGADTVKIAEKVQEAKTFLKRWEAKIANYIGKISPKAKQNFIAYTGFETDYTYDNEQKLTQITSPDSSAISYSYDTTGTLSGITLPTGSNGYSFSYGATPLSFTSGDGTTENFSYQGYLLTNDQINFNATSTRYAIMAYTYGNNNNFQTASDVATSNATTSGTTINYGYDHDTLLTSAGSETITRSTTTGYVSTAKVGNLTETYSYTSDMGELSSILAKYNTTQDYSESFTRDALGRISTRTEQYTSGTSNTYGYTYDSAGRLTTVTLGGTTISSYSYDTNSNRTSQTLGSTTTTATYDGQDRVSTFGTRTYTFSSSGELESYSDSGYSPAHVTSFSYDVLGNLKSVAPPSGSEIYYKVDAQNRRIEKLTGTTVDNYFMYDSKNRVVALVSSSGAITSRFIYGVHPNTPDYMIKSGTTYKIISNHLGSPVQVVASSSGTISEQIVYDEFGNITSDSSPGFQPFGFAGCLYDTDTKLCRFGARDYDAYTGRWLVRDPILFSGRQSNLYNYSFNDPINFTDQFGLAPGDVFPTVDGAGSDAINYTNPMSVSQNREFAGSIFPVPGGYSYTPPGPGDASHSVVPHCPDAAGTYHTHGAYDPTYDNESYSPADYENTANRGIRNYLGTPSGQSKVLDPVSTLVTPVNPTNGGMSPMNPTYGVPSGSYSR